MVAGMIGGFITALLFSCSYLGSAFFIRKHNSSLELLIFSQLFMGAVSLLLLPFFIPAPDGGARLKFLLFLLVWMAAFSAAQGSFFYAQKYIESSRISSLLGLKILVLALMWMLFYGKTLNLWQSIGIVLSVIAAVGMNWSGGHFALKGVAGVAVTIICFCLTDFAGFEMVYAVGTDNIVKSGITVALFAYALLGIVTLPFLIKVRWSRQKQLDAIPFALFWLPSQFTVLICFGLLDPVFGNVIQASRGVISVFLGMLACRIGLNVMECRISKKLWIRRILAALLMVGGIACFSFGRISG